MNRINLFRILGIPELRAILKNHRLLLFLLLAISISFWGLGFREGALIYLSKKMESPFVRYISLSLKNEKGNTSSEAFRRIIMDCDSSVTKNRFDISTTHLLSLDYFQIIDRNGTKTKAAKVLPLEPSSSMYTYLTSPDFQLSNSFRPLSTSKWSVVVTVSFLEELGYGNNEESWPPYLEWEIATTPESQISIIPVAGVVKQLPFDCSMMLTKEFAETKTADAFFFNLKNINQDYLSVFVNEEEVEKFATHFPAWKKEPNRETFKNGKIFTKEGVSDIGLELNEIKNLGINSYFQRVDFDRRFQPNPEKATQDYLILEMNELDSVSSLKNYLFTKHKLEIDLNTVESKNNYQLFENISTLLGVLLSFFSVLFITYVTTRLVLEHIERNAKNLGTLKAFGLSNLSITLIYSIISTVIVLIIVSASFIIARLIAIAFSPHYFGIQDIQGLNLIKVFSFQFGFQQFIVFIIIPIVLCALLIFSGLRKTTPGDLIYER